MGRTPFVPEELRKGPFTLEDARRAGLERWHPEGSSWKRLGWGSYAWAGLADTTLSRLVAARRRLPEGAAFSGLTAAWLHGIDVLPCDPIEATVPLGAGVYARSGMRIRRADLAEADVVALRGMTATTLVRTVAEACGRLSLVDAVVLADAALHSRRRLIEALNKWASTRRGHGVARLRRVLSLAEPAAESPMETRLRMVLERGGVPRPKAQVSIRDADGRVVGRVDLYYEEARLGIEFDGGIHRDTLIQDNRRQNYLLSAGVRLLRFTSADVLGNPDSVVQQVRAMLRSNCPGRSEPRA